MNRTYQINASGSLYRKYEEKYPNHAIIMKEGFFYSAHNQSAVVLNLVLDYRLAYDMYGRVTTGGPDPDKIANALKADDFNFVLAEKETIIVKHDGRNPFTFLNIADADLILPVDRFQPEQNLRQSSGLVSMKNAQEYGKIVKNKSVYPQNLIKELFVTDAGLPKNIEERLDRALDKVAFNDELEREILMRRIKEGISMKELQEQYDYTSRQLQRIVDKCLLSLQRRTTFEYLLGNIEMLDTDEV